MCDGSFTSTGPVSMYRRTLSASNFVTTPVPTGGVEWERRGEGQFELSVLTDDLRVRGESTRAAAYCLVMTLEIGSRVVRN